MMKLTLPITFVDNLIEVFKTKNKQLQHAIANLDNYCPVCFCKTFKRSLLSHLLVSSCVFVLRLRAIYM